MHKVKLLLIMALIVSLSYSLSISSIVLQSDFSSELKGSIMGGTKLAIKGLGFSSTMMDNSILVGDFPCKL